MSAIRLVLCVLGIVAITYTGVHALEWIDSSLFASSLNQLRSSLLNSDFVFNHNNPSLKTFFSNDTKHKCPPCPSCFNCNGGADVCENFSVCHEASGKCMNCPLGFGGENCGVPLCGSPVKKRRSPPENGRSCKCDDGWTGLNCNICARDSVCHDMPEYNLFPVTDVGCYTGPVVKYHQFKKCSVSLDPYIEKLLGGKKASLTVDCKKSNPNSPTEVVDCAFQFWLDEEEIFYCSMDQCLRGKDHLVPVDDKHNNVTVSYGCPDVRCSCFKDSLLCDAGKMVDITPFLELVTGPAVVECAFPEDSSSNPKAYSCRISEKTLDSYLSKEGLRLNCSSGECLPKSKYPAINPDAFLSGPTFQFIVSIVVGSLFALIWFGFFIAVLYYIYRRHSITKPPKTDGSEGDPLLSSNELTYLAEVPSFTLSFKDLGFVVNAVNEGESDKWILQETSGIAQPGHLFAIMGASGSGKTTCLNLLAGQLPLSSGTIMINGQELKTPAEFRYYQSHVGYVRQQDLLLPTLTVRESLLYTAFLRLPTDFSEEQKKLRVHQVLRELNLDHVADELIGTPPTSDPNSTAKTASKKGGISGGERRRLSIAMELITAPSILFLDEPTSGLDSNTAALVIDTLLRLARKHNRTIVISIHQPRSDVFVKFDSLLLLASGLSLYSGPAGDQVASYFAMIDLPCPSGYNIGDHLLDVSIVVPDNVEDEDQVEVDMPHEPRRLENVPWYKEVFGKKKPLKESPRQVLVRRRARVLSDYFTHSTLGQTLINSIESSRSDTEFIDQNLACDPNLSLFKQIDLLALRTFTNLYRNPYLFRAQYTLAIGIALFCGLLFYDLPMDLSGVQNRLGFFFFTLAFFAFSSLTSSMASLSTERPLFLLETSHQRSYSVLAYYLAKLWMDILPLRILPPILYAGISYFMIRLYPAPLTFMKFTLVICLFNIVISAFCFTLAVKFKTRELANMAATLCILFSMLFGGFLLNKDRLPLIFVIFKYVSFFNYAFESLIVNELINISLKDDTIVEIEVPGVVILQQFGFHADAFWTDVTVLLAMAIGFLVLTLFFLVRSSRTTLF